MRIVRDRADARGLPSRRRFALARLVAYARMRNAKPETRTGVMIAIDRDQSATEQYSVAAWVLVTIACYLVAVLAPRIGALAAALVAIPAAGLAAQIPFYITGLLATPFHAGDNMKLNAVSTMSVLIVVSSYFATVQSWVRFVAWFFFAVLALNALAAVVLWPLRGAIRELETRCGA